MPFNTKCGWKTLYNRMTVHVSYCKTRKTTSEKTWAIASNNRKIEIPFVSISSLYHLLGPTQCNKSRLLPNYNKQDVGPYMLFVNPMFKE
jgi:hypothetical protein